MTSFINLRRVPNGQQTEPTAHLCNLPKEPSPTQCHDKQGQCEVSSFLSLLAHRTPSDDGMTRWISATFRSLTICALCRCPMVCPLTRAWLSEDFRELQTCRAVHTAPRIASRTVDRTCPLGGRPCRAIH
jgi:hypothetical protein